MIEQASVQGDGVAKPAEESILVVEQASVAGDGVAKPAEESIVTGWPTWDELRRRYLRAVLVHTKQNKTHAVRVLGIDRRTLNRVLARERKRGLWEP